MNEIKLNIRALAAMMNLTLKELAEQSGADYRHLFNVAYRGTALRFEEGLKLSKFTGVPVENIVFLDKKSTE